MSDDPELIDFEDDRVSAFLPAWPDPSAVEVCEDLIAGIEGSPSGLQVAYSCVECPRPLLCQTCFELHMVGHGRLSCVTCGDPVAELARCDLPTPSLWVRHVSVDEVLLAPFRGGIEAVASLCAAHEGGNHWQVTSMIDVLGTLDD